MKTFNKVWRFIFRNVDAVARDDLPIYAAQASFFVIISVVPFLSLLVSIASFFIPDNIQLFIDSFQIPESMKSLAGSLVDELQGAPKVSLLSVSAIITLWISSKGVTSIRSGIEKVYCAKRKRGMVIHRLWTLIGTLVFVAMLIAAIVLLIFGRNLVSLLSITKVTEVLMYLRTPILALFMCILFTVMYAIVARRSEIVKRNVFTHVPGAMIASVGWILFSYIYSLYIRYFPAASYIYGGLAAVCLIMLWLYFCMMILLLGAEVNKLFFACAPKKTEEQ